MRNKCLFALGLVFAMSLTSIVAFAFSFTGEPDVKNDQKQIVVVNPATESEETTSEQTVWQKQRTQQQPYSRLAVH